jgi:hypothetical protein
MQFWSNRISSEVDISDVIFGSDDVLTIQTPFSIVVIPSFLYVNVIVYCFPSSFVSYSTREKV